MNLHETAMSWDQSRPGAWGSWKGSGSEAGSHWKGLAGWAGWVGRNGGEGGGGGIWTLPLRLLPFPPLEESEPECFYSLEGCTLASWWETVELKAISGLTFPCLLITAHSWRLERLDQSTESAWRETCKSGRYATEEAYLFSTNHLLNQSFLNTKTASKCVIILLFPTKLT